MGFYDLDKEQRDELVDKINNDIHAEIINGLIEKTTVYFSDSDTYFVRLLIWQQVEYIKKIKRYISILSVCST